MGDQSITGVVEKDVNGAALGVTAVANVTGWNALGRSLHVFFLYRTKLTVARRPMRSSACFLSAAPSSL